jgi:hypothetical protein
MIRQNKPARLVAAFLGAALATALAACTSSPQFGAEIRGSGAGNFQIDLSKMVQRVQQGSASFKLIIVHRVGAGIKQVSGGRLTSADPNVPMRTKISRQRKRDFHIPTVLEPTYLLQLLAYPRTEAIPRRGNLSGHDQSGTTTNSCLESGRESACRASPSFIARMAAFCPH